MGMFLDDTAMLVIVAPLYVPLVISLGFDPIWYGVLYTISCQIAYMTPPFGYNLFLMRAMAPPEVTLADIYRSIIPFVLVMIVGHGNCHGVSADRSVVAAVVLCEMKPAENRDAGRIGYKPSVTCPTGIETPESGLSRQRWVGTNQNTVQGGS